MLLNFFYLLFSFNRLNINTNLLNLNFPEQSSKILLTDKKLNIFIKYLSLVPTTNLCDISNRGMGNVPEKIALHKIAFSSYLIELNCFLGYNNLNQYLIYSEDSQNYSFKIIGFDTLSLTSVEQGKTKKIQETIISGRSQFSPKDKLLIMDTKARGVGGCGTLGKFKLIDERFKIFEYKYFPCYKLDKRMEPRSPDDYPLIYP